MENIIMLILGVFISVMGIVNIKGNISTIHSYNRRRVKEEDIPKYGKVVGTGTLIIQKDDMDDDEQAGWNDTTYEETGATDITEEKMEETEIQDETIDLKGRNYIVGIEDEYFELKEEPAEITEENVE